MRLLEVPVIDVGPFLKGSPTGQREVTAQVARACEDIGFLTVVGHGVPHVLIELMSGVSREFFNLPLEEKRRWTGPDPSRGYRPMGDESLSYSLGDAAPPDLKETLDVGPVDVAEDVQRDPDAAPYFVANIWPETPGALREVWTCYYRAMARLAADLMRIFAVALDLPEPFFADKIDRHISRMRAINYPEPTGRARPGQLRSGAHSDYGSLTILHVEDAPGGLQVRNRQDQWVDVTPMPGSLVVNLGDLMMHWTNDRWISTLHRVANPPARQRRRSRRQSLVFFHQPNHDALIECLPSCHGPGHPPRYAPITSGAHRRAKFLKTVMRAAR